METELKVKDVVVCNKGSREIIGVITRIVDKDYIILSEHCDNVNPSLVSFYPTEALIMKSTLRKADAKEKGIFLEHLHKAGFTWNFQLNTLTFDSSSSEVI